MNIKSIKKEFSEKNNNLFKSFFPNSNYNFKFNEINKFRKFKTVIVLGMGGSILGTKAIYSFLKYKIKKKFIFIDNLDQEKLIKTKKNYNLKNVLFLIISKSGNTTETIVNTGFFKPFLKKSNTIIIAEDKNNLLANFAKEKSFKLVKHSSKIGGRYSVFSDVGMLPSYLMGLNPINFKKNIPKLFNNNVFLKESIKQIKKIKLKKFKTLIFFNYLPELEDFLFWSQQLIAESLGKKKTGIMPVMSSAPKDHHSLLQLYLDGPRDKYFYIFSVKKNKRAKLRFNSLGKKTSFLNKKNYENIKNAQKDAFKKALDTEKIPYREIIINKIDENNIGKLFFTFILETFILSKIIKVNPFNQPAVEKVKIFTKKILISNNFSKKNF